MPVSAASLLVALVKAERVNGVEVLITNKCTLHKGGCEDCKYDGAAMGVSILGSVLRNDGNRTTGMGRNPARPASTQERWDSESE